ncbi:MAG: valine--tRNA ligase [Acidobacteria bacterium RBG_13_68_16]|nr:MAG: valine--tRNA ligase [Acidobacteria bacterium RBG_13_68_16]
MLDSLPDWCAGGGVSRREQLPTRFDPASFEGRWYAAWEASGAFTPEQPSAKAPFVILIPPPNVTGKLHIGHALQFTLQDLVIRWRRMQGRNALWLPGTDHAGIATQVMVERELAKEGTSRRELGREKFLKRMWEWKAQYKDNISHQAKALGASCDWTRERFTLDEMLSRAVRYAFVSLYREGLIYRAHRLINWCPRCLTALSDLEVVHKEVDGGMWDFAYPLVDGGEIVVSTSRPETMLGDTAVAVHPTDERYRQLIGRQVQHPLLDRRFPVIADEVLVDPAFGTGAVKVTPAHDANDFATGERHALEKINILNEDGTINSNGGPFAGQDRFAARKAVLAALGEKGLRRGEKTHRHAVGHCQRCDTVVEPYLSKQWFCSMRAMADRALEAVRSGDVRLVPDFWVSTYENWLENILDWCISRQLWWGHRIPAFYCPDGHTTVSEEDVTACGECGRPVERDPDVLDTWFSSALWPISTLGWPEDTADMRAFYPTSVMITGFDILFFWVARMVMMGCHFTGKAPFAHVHLTGLVRDARGQKMSKTKGNVMDPLDLVEQYGADAVRFTLAALASPGRDLPLDAKRMEGYHAFGTKLWNAARFVQMNLDGSEAGLEQLDPGRLALPEAWILTELERTTAAVNRSWENYRFDEACRELYQFVWNDFCDWYLEMAKPVLQEGGWDGRRADDVRAVARGVLIEALKLLHPVMPFITEEIARHLGSEDPLITTPYPAAGRRTEFPHALAVIAAFQAVVQETRSYRHLVGLPPGTPLALFLVGLDPARREAFSSLATELSRLAGLSTLGLNPTSVPAEAIRDLAGGVNVAIVLPEGALGEAERARLAAELAQVETELGQATARLSDASFTARAPKDVVAGSRVRAAELTHKVRLLTATLEHRS